MQNLYNVRMEGLSQPEKRKSAAAEGRAADFIFARETLPLLGQEETEAIDSKIAALKAQKQEGRKFIASMTNERMIEIAEKSEGAIDAQISELERQRVTGEKTATN